RRAPAVPFLPAAMHGRPVIAVAACYAGAIEAGGRGLRPLRAVGPPPLQPVAPQPHPAPPAQFDAAGPHRGRPYSTAWGLPALGDDVAEVLVAHATAATSPLSYCVIFQLGGAIGRVGEDETAYSRRGMGHDVNINAVWTPDDPAPARHVRWARDFWSALE